MASRRAARSAADMCIRGSSSTTTSLVASLFPALILMVYLPGSTSGPRGPKSKPAAAACICSGVGTAGEFHRKSQFVRFTPTLPGPSNSRTSFPSLSYTLIFTLPSFFAASSVFASWSAAAVSFLSFSLSLSFSSLAVFGGSGGTHFDVVIQNRAVRRILRGKHLLPRTPPPLPQIPERRGPRAEKRQLGTRHTRVELLDRRKVIKNPDRPPVRRQHQVVLLRLDLDVIHRHGRKIILQRRPIAAAIPGHPESKLRSRKEQICVSGMLAHHVHRPCRIRYSVADCLPALSIIRRQKNVHVVVVVAVAVERCIRRAFAILRRHHAAHISSFRHPRHSRRHILPGLSAVACYLQVPVVRSHPKHLCLQRRLTQSRDGRVFLDAVVTRQCILVRYLAEDRQLVSVHSRGQIAAQPRPRVSSIRRLKQIISAIVDRLVIVRRNRHWRIPLKTVVRLACLGFRHDLPLLSGVRVAPRNMSVLRFGINYPRLDVIDLRVEPVAARHQRPILIRNPVTRQRHA